MVAAGQAQRLFDADPSRKVAICDRTGVVRWHPIWEGNPAIATPQDVANCASVQRVTSGPHCRPYIVYPFTTETGWTFDRSFRCRDHVSKLYLSHDEWARGTAARKRYGPYVLIEPFTKHGNFRWPLHRWEQVVAACPDLTFVQHVHPETRGLLVRGAHVEQASFQEACGLIASAEVYLRSESGLCHAAAALGRPQVTLFGGCMDPQVMGGYPGQTVLADRGPGSPCGSWNPCQHCDAAMAAIGVSDVLDALRGRLRAQEAA